MQLDADEDGSPFFNPPVGVSADAPSDISAAETAAGTAGVNEQERPETRDTDGSETVAASSTAEEEEGHADSHAAAAATAEAED